MTVYAIRAIGTSYVKIGHTDRNDADSRMRGLQVSNPHKLEILAIVVRGSLALEKRLHYYLRDRRVSGEWFQLDAAQRNRLKYLFQASRRWKSTNGPDSEGRAIFKEIESLYSQAPILHLNLRRGPRNTKEMIKKQIKQRKLNERLAITERILGMEPT